MSIYVGNLSYESTEDEIKKLFSEYGSVASVRLIHDRETDRFKGFGFVEMGSSNEESDAIEKLNGQDFKGRQLKVNPARS
jgi:RNA recognition motif-containing protein|tara:strand:- start:2844 stop:3083 length:240 start_codon:yes stop_codon:yes gene_type:complete